MIHALVIKKLTKIYANGVHAVKGIDLTVEKGDFFALLGANGAGKSTTIGMITTLVKKTSGGVIINGYDLEHQREQAKACLGLVPQEMNLNVFETCEEILLNQAGYYGLMRKAVRPYAHSLLEQLGLAEKRTAIVRHLSGGMKRRLMIARALIHQPQLLILDEPTAGVDVEIRRSIWHFLTQLNQQGMTIILTTHYLEEAEQLCKNLAIIDKGDLIKNSSIKALLQSIHHQTFVFNTVNPLLSTPDLSPLVLKLIDKTTFELRVDDQFSLNELFSLLSAHGIQVHSMRPKTNRLEELFLDLIHDD